MIREALHSDGCAGNCGTNDSDNPPCPAADRRLMDLTSTDEAVEVLYAGLAEVIGMEAKTHAGRRSIVEEFLRPVHRRGFRFAVAPSAESPESNKP